MPHTFHLDEATVHHGDAALARHLEVSHLCLRQRMFRCVEFDEAMLVVGIGTGLTGMDAPIGCDCDDGFHLAASCGGSYGSQSSAGKGFPLGDALSGKSLFNQFGLLI